MVDMVVSKSELIDAERCTLDDVNGPAPAEVTVYKIRVDMSGLGYT